MPNARTCKFPDCDSRVYGHGWCQKHYHRWRRHGDPTVVLPRRRSYESAGSRIARLSRHDGDCLVFTGGQRLRSGHRMISFKNAPTGVHRVAYELAKGPIPSDQVVMHWCDNPPCVEPSHLRLGSVADNNRDRDLKGRHARLRGSKNGNARLAEWQVAEIKARLLAGESTYRLAAKYSTSQSNVWMIKAGKAWRQVAPACLREATPS